MDEERFRAKLNPEQYRIMREGGAEMPYVTKYWDHYESGIYFCAACGARLFSSLAKFNAGEGWPTFRNPANGSAIEAGKNGDVVCRKCKSHLGQPVGEGEHKYYRINSACLDFEAVGIEFEEKEKEEDGKKDDKTAETHPDASVEQASRKSSSWSVTIAPAVFGGVIGLIAGVGVGVVWCDRSEIRFEGAPSPAPTETVVPSSSGVPAKATPVNAPPESSLAPKIAPSALENMETVVSPTGSSVYDGTAPETGGSVSPEPSPDTSSGVVDTQSGTVAPSAPADPALR